MRSFDFNNIQETTEGQREPLPAGGYVVRIVDMYDVPEKDYVKLVWDIAEGPRAGEFDSQWGRNNEWAHVIYMSYSDKALGFLKGRLKAISESNAGFDAMAAWNGGRLDMFRGRLFGVNLREEEYVKDDGSIGSSLKVCQVIKADDVRQGKVMAWEKKTADAPVKPSTATGSYDNIVIPFD